jgi:hypothetical protein
VRGGGEADVLQPEFPDESHHVGGQVVGREVADVGELAVVAAEVHAQHPVVLTEQRREVPEQAVILRPAVQQDQWRGVRCTGLDVLERESVDGNALDHAVVSSRDAAACCQALPNG